MNNTIPYGRNTAETELQKPKLLEGKEIININSAGGATTERIEQLKNSEINYNVSYCFLLDCIHAYCYDFYHYIGDCKITAPDPISNYCTIRLTPQELEYYSLGDFSKYPHIRLKLWKHIRDVANSPKSLVMMTDEGIFQGQPITMIIKRKNDDINRHGGKTSNLKNQENNTPIEYININFFYPFFKNIMTDSPKNYLLFPRNFQAILEYEYITNPQYFNFICNSKYDGSTTLTLTTNYVRQHFLYIQYHNNHMGNYLNIDAIKYLQCLRPSALYKKEVVKDGEIQEVLNLKSYWKENAKMDRLNALHSHLLHEGNLSGFDFTTCKTYYDKENKIFKIKICRKKPLEKAPIYEENYPLTYNKNENQGYIEIVDLPDIPF